jgi:uncharacterized delta-60 repeat protein
MSIRSVAAAALLYTVTLAPPAAAAVAPGRVTFPIAPRARHVGDDPRGLSVGAAVPGGGVVLAGLDAAGAIVLAQLRPDGSLDPAFGTAGIAHVAVPTSPLTLLQRGLQLLRERDGRLLLVAAANRTETNENDRLVIVGLSADGTLDGSFGSGGVAAPGVQSSCQKCSPAALAPDGSIVLTGNTGEIPPGIAQHPGVVVDFHWAVARLTPTGLLDPRFGAQGIATLPGTSGVGYASASLPGGAIAVLGAGLGGPKLARLTPTGAADPFFNHGEPVGLPRAVLFWFGLRGRADGSVDALGSAKAAQLVRYTATGNLDPDFGTGGVVSRVLPLTLGEGPAELLRAPHGGDIVVAPFAANSTLQTPRLRAARVTSKGTVASAADVPLVFGGGATSAGPVADETSVRQDGFVPGRVLARADGSVLLPGAVGVIQRTARDFADGIYEAAVAAVTPALALDPSFGGRARPPTIAVRLAPERQATAVGVIARTSGPGLCLLRARAGGRVVARSTVAIFTAGPQRLRARLTSTGRRALRGAHGVPVMVTATFRDLVGGQASARAAGTLR